MHPYPFLTLFAAATRLRLVSRSTRPVLVAVGGLRLFGDYSRIALALMALVQLGWLAPLQAETSERPNIVFLLTDNHRWDAMGCYGNSLIQTPRMDKLAARGARFTNAYCTTSICAASRVSILTGKYRKRHGYTFERPYLTTAAMQQSYPAVLRQAGYRTAFVGKLGLNVEDGVLDEMFDFVKLNTANSLRNPYYRTLADGSLRHLTQINGDQAVDFLHSCGKDRPFCLSVSFSAPHPEDDHPDQYIFDRELEELYRDVTIPAPAASDPRYFEQLPEFIRVSMNRQRWFRRFDTPEKYQRMMKGMYRLISGVDRQVGRVLDTLDELGCAENTIVIVTADNGLMAGEHGLTGIWLMYEQSIRLPLIVYDPRRQGSAAIDQIALNVDYAPTILDLAGVPIPHEMQGRSLAPLLEGRSEDWRDEFFYEHYFRPAGLQSNQGNIPRSEGVRTVDWKYVRYYDEQPVYQQLFDLTNDPWETNNLAADARFEQKRQAMHARMLRLRSEVGHLDLAAIHRSADYSKLAAAPTRSRLDDQGTAPAWLGSHLGQAEFFLGELDDVQIYQQALTSEQITSLAAGEINVAEEHLVGRWRLDGNLRNSAPAADGELRHPAEPVGGVPEFVDGRRGQAMRLNGVNRSARIEHYEGLKPTTGQITLAAWIRPSSTPDGWCEIYRKEDGPARQLLAIGKTGFYGLWCGLGIDGSYVEYGAPVDREQLNDGGWHHVSATFDGQSLSLYLDGNQIGQYDLLGEAVEDGQRNRPLRIALVGNTLIEKAAEHGYLETEVTRLWPNTDIAFSNLGWAGDTVQGDARVEFGPNERSRQAWQRPAGISGDYGFQKLLAQIRGARPHVLFVGYGSNIAFEGQSGLRRFQQGLDRLLRALEPTEVRIVLLAPPRREIRQMARANLTRQDRWLRQVSLHLQKVAGERGHLFVDLFHLWPPYLDGSTIQLTDNGLHLNTAGYQRLASIVVDQLNWACEPWELHLNFDGSVVAASGTHVEAIKRTHNGLRMSLLDAYLPQSHLGAAGRDSRTMRIAGLPPGMFGLHIDGHRVARGSAEQWAAGITLATGPEFDQLQELRQVILEKNRLDSYGFRPQNKAYIHLFRRHERGHHAEEVRQFARLAREREGEIARLRVPKLRHYELMREQDYPDHEVPRLIQQPDIEAELRSFTLADGFEINLFAADPLIINPININWDEQGRLWVATSTVYPHLQPGQLPDDRIVVLEDIDGDGRADKHTVFAQGLLVPHSVIPAGGGAYVTQSTDLLFLKDTDGDGQADHRQVVLTGFGNADVHHMIHGLRWGPGGDLYFDQSIYINSTVETPWGVRQVNGSCIWRFRPDTLRLETFSRGLVNPWGHAIDRWGQSFATDGAGGDGIAYVFPGSAHSTHGAFARTLESLNPGRPKECGLEIISGRHLPSEWRDSLVTCDFRANRVARYRLSTQASGYSSQFLGDVLSSTHRAFRPVDVKMGPDGALYIVDWYNPIIDHGEVDFHHPLRDKRHGRIWRLTAKGRPLVQPLRLHDATVWQLLQALKLPEAWTRDQARRLLREQGRDRVAPVCGQWVARLEESHPDCEHHRLEALWVFQGLRVVAPNLLRQTLTAVDHRVRAAAVRVLAEWHGQLPDAMPLLQAAVRDDHAQVRLEAVHALRRIGSRQAVEMALQVLERPLDNNLDFAAWLTAREGRSSWLAALESGDLVFAGDPEKINFALAAAEETAALGPLVDLIRSGKLNEHQRLGALQTLALLGEFDEQALVVEELTSGSPQDVSLLLASLAEARHVEQPPANASRILRHLKSGDHHVRLQTVQLLGRWKVVDAWDELLAMAGQTEINPRQRLAASQALVAIDRQQGLRELKEIADTDGPNSLRITAVAAWAAADPAPAAVTAAAVLAELGEADDPTAIFTAYIHQKEGPRLLAAAMSKQTAVASAVASRGVRLASQSGRDLSVLVDALIRRGNLDPLPEMASPQQIAQLVDDVAARGDPYRGEAIYHRRELQCLKCHAIGGAGGLVGPDLASLGGSAQIHTLIESLLTPSGKIKEGYQTWTILDSNGQVFSGRIQRRTPETVVLRDANDQLITIATAKIDEMAASPLSLMPVGLTKTLRRDELLDLVRFLSVLGKDDNFRVPANNYVRSWQVLEPTPDVVQRLRRDGDQDVVQDDQDMHWSIRYSTVAGTLPLADVPLVTLAGGRRASYVRFDIPPAKKGPVELMIQEPDGLEVWLDGRWVRVPIRRRLAVSADPRIVTLRVDRAGSATAVTIELGQ